MSPYTRAPERIERARDRAAARETLLVLLNRVDRLSPTEGALLREYALAELTEADQLTRARRGLDRARDRLQRRADTADAEIVKIEAERDQAREQLAQAEDRIRTLHAVDIGRTHGAARVTAERDQALARLLQVERVRERTAEYCHQLAREVDEHRQARHVAEAALAAIRTPDAAGPRHPVHTLMDALRGPGIREEHAISLIRAYWLAITHKEPNTPSPKQPVRDEADAPLCTCTYAQQCPACARDEATAP
ncbi:hypothetical protein ABZ567_31290 [Streptomyces sp. NPDC016459]|uniref:hypothetical protein n=1 Tax=Streptomyces sp. NPDC016459 TaxID=3157190 RepID=UPI0033D7AA70